MDSGAAVFEFDIQRHDLFLEIALLSRFPGAFVTSQRKRVELFAAYVVILSQQFGSVELAELNAGVLHF